MQRQDDIILTFEEVNHKYTDSLNIVYTSVTETIDRYFSPFNANQVIAGMMKADTWPKSPYFGMTSNEIKAEWKHSADLGTLMHSYIETAIKLSCTDTPYGPKLNKNTLISEVECLIEKIELKTELSYFLQFVQKELEDNMYCLSEFRVFSRTLGIAGTIDLLLYDEDGKCKIFDWKRCGSIRKENKYKKGKGIFAEVEDCTYNHYSLQLNLYRHILESNYSLQGIQLVVNEMKLFVFHPCNTEYLCHPIERDTKVALIQRKE